MGSVLNRQDEMKGHARLRVVSGPKPASMRLDNGSADGQAHAEPMGFGREERVEQLFLVGWINADPGILDAHKRLAPVRTRGHDPKAPLVFLDCG